MKFRSYVCTVNVDGVDLDSCRLCRTCRRPSGNRVKHCCVEQHPVLRTRALLGTGLVNSDKFGELGGVTGRPLNSGVLDGSSADVAGVTARPLSECS